MKKVYQLKGLPDCSAPMTANSIILNSFEQTNPGSFYQDLGISSKSMPVLYCLAGHKISAGLIPLQINQDRMNLATSSKEVSASPRV